MAFFLKNKTSGNGLWLLYLRAKLIFLSPLLIVFFVFYSLISLYHYLTHKKLLSIDLE